jgi:hypothetical protein
MDRSGLDFDRDLVVPVHRVEIQRVWLIPADWEVAGWTGLEPDSPRRCNYLMACELWSQRVEYSKVGVVNRVREIPGESARIDPGRGDIVETP